MSYLGDFTTANTVYVPFHTFDSNDPSASVIISAFVVGDIAIYKNGSVTQRTSTAGFTLLDTDGINFDGVVGIHGFSVDLSDDTDSGFYAAGGEYFIVVGPVTIDAATVNFVAGAFSIERTGGVLALLKGTNSLANIEDKIDIIDTNVDQIETAVITNAAGVDIAADIIAVKDETVLIVADTGELQTDWVNGGRLDLLLDAIPTTTMRGTDGANTTTPPTVVEIRAEMDSNSVELAKIALADAGAGVTGSLAEEIQNRSLQATVDAIETDTQDIQSRIPTALVGGRIDANIGAINAVVNAAIRLGLSANQIIPFTVDTVTNTHTPTTTVFQADDITEATADHFNGRVVIFTSGVLDGQATSISDYEAVGGIGQFTVVAMTEPAANNDTGYII